MDFGVCRLQRFFVRKPSIKTKKEPKETDELIPDGDTDDLFVERIRIENLQIRFPLVL